MKPTILLLILLALVVPVATAQGPASSRPPIIDVHMHAYSKDEPWTPIPNPVTGQAATVTSAQGHMQATLAEMKKHNIVNGFVSGDYTAVLSWKTESPDRITVSYGRGDPSPEDLALMRKEHAAGRLKVLGEVGAQYRGVSPLDPQMEPFFAMAEELDIPVGIHTGLGPPGTPYTCCPKFRTTLGNPQLLEQVLVKHPKLRIYLMHGGYPYLQETKAIMYMYPQVYADLAVINWIIPREEFHDYLRALVRAGFGQRLMFGSDQMQWPEAIGMAVEGVESASFLTEEQKRDIFYNNAVRFFRLGTK